MKSKLEELKAQVAELEKQQQNCTHDWEDAVYDPERREIMADEFVDLHGLDSFHKRVGTGMFEEVDRWARICKKCGKVEYTYTQEEVAVKTEKRPKFSN